MTLSKICSWRCRGCIIRGATSARSRAPPRWPISTQNVAALGMRLAAEDMAELESLAAADGRVARGLVLRRLPHRLEGLRDASIVVLEGII